MKQSSDITEKLMDLQKKKKDVTTTRDAPVALPDGTAPTNNIFVGSTTELQKFLQLNKEKEKDVTPESNDV
jgi:hypothetical protein